MIPISDLKHAFLIKLLGKLRKTDETINEYVAKKLSDK